MNIKVIRIASGKAGVGRTTFAVNFATALSQLGKRVLLVDGDMVGAEVATELGMTGVQVGFREVFYYKMDVKKAIIRYDESNLDVLPAVKNEENFSPTPDQIRSLGAQIDLFEYDFIIVDTAVDFYLPQFALYYTNSMVVTTPDESSIDATLRLVSQYTESKLRFDIVLNRYRNADYELKTNEIEGILHKKLCAVLPEDEIVIKSTNMHRPAYLMNKEANYCKAVAALAKDYL